MGNSINKDMKSDDKVHLNANTAITKKIFKTTNNELKKKKFVTTYVLDKNLDVNRRSFGFQSSSNPLSSSSSSKTLLSSSKSPKTAASSKTANIATSHLHCDYGQDTPENFQKRFDAIRDKPSKIVKRADGLIGSMEIVRTLGTGSFGIVVLVRTQSELCPYDVPPENCDDNFKFASVKIMNKERLVELNQVDHVMAEKEILAALRSPFIVKFYESFKDNSNIYLTIEYLGGGELFTHLRKSKRFNESLSRFFVSQVVLALEYLHSLRIIYRDLKPENIMLANNGYIKITDFGFAKQIKSRTWTMCGTPEYLAPEIILNKGYNETVDYWALGILIYELNAGFPPFCDSTPMKIYEKILQGRMKLLPFFSNSLRNLIKSLLHSDVTCRMGNLNMTNHDLKDHEWFSSYIRWDDIYNQRVKSTYKINSSFAGDSNNFEDIEALDLSSDEQCMYEGDFKYF